MTTPNTFKLADQTIAGIMQLLSISMLTGTNLLDHLRLLELYLDDEGLLSMTDDFIARSDSFVNACVEQLPDEQDGTAHD